jgi:5'-phosphate synthase pdxT subunit
MAETAPSKAAIAGKAIAQTKKKRVGVLALQGDFDAHAKAITLAGGDAVEVRTAEDMDSVDGLVIPGGESTTMLKLLNMMNLVEPLAEFTKNKPVFGTCAGAILMATEVTNPTQQSFGAVDLTVERNAYGRQIDSRVTNISPVAEFQKRAGEGDVEAVFIRAPIIRRTGPGVKVLAEYEGDPVLVEQGRHLIATFHPELTHDARVHRLFLSKL